MKRKLTLLSFRGHECVAGLEWRHRGEAVRHGPQPERRAASGGAHVPAAGGSVPRALSPYAHSEVLGGQELGRTLANPLLRPDGCISGNGPGSHENITGFIKGPQPRRGSIQREMCLSSV